MPLGVLRRHALAAADALERLQDGLLAGGMPLEERLGLATRLGDAEQQVLGRDELVAQAARLGLGALDDGLGPRVEAERAALDPGAPRERSGDLAAERRQVDAEAAEGLRRDPVIGLDERAEQVLGVEHGALESLRRLLGGDDGLLGLLGESIELHVQVSQGCGGRVGRRVR